MTPAAKSLFTTPAALAKRPRSRSTVVRLGAREDDFEWLYRAHEAVLRRHLIKATRGDHHLTEDILQETFLRAWRTPPELSEHPESGRSWLMTVARNILIDRIRERDRRPVEDLDDEMPQLVAPQGQLDGLLTAMALRRALATLTRAQLETVEQVILRDRSVNEAAEHLGVPVGTVKSRVYYALRVLRRELAASPGGTDIDLAA